MLATGFRLGPYEVLAKIGEGGMGEVYRARDLKLGRDVALKILPEPFASDPERLGRFRREAQLLAALNHPNIAGIYGLDDSTSTVALVLELVEGETLAERLERGRIPLDEALRIARQIGDALDAAHERGIIHRDLKPANVKITPDGKVKVLDFGLAKLADPVAVDVSALPTITSPGMVTSIGTILGTAAYMSPEQARGQTADKRSDIWAFGCILYEMLSGTRLFDGATTSDALASVLTKQPDWTPIPVAVRSLLQRCLDREPSRRLRDIGDAWHLLDAPAVQPKPSRVTWIVPALVVVSAVAVAVAQWTLMRRTAATASTTSLPQLTIAVGIGRVATATESRTAILSPDGTQVVFVDAGADGITRLSVRRLDQPTATVLPKTDGASAPFFKPDGASVGFFAHGKLKTINLIDSDVRELCDAPSGRGGTWNDHGQIVAALDTLTHLSLVPERGGAVTPLSELASGETTHRWPQFLPGGNAVVFMVNSSPGYYDRASIAVLSLMDNPQWIKKIVLPNAGMSPQYLATGHLVYATNGTLFAVPFDPVRLEVRGKPVAVLEDLSTVVNFGSVQIDFDRQGSALYRKGHTLGRTIVHWLSADGRATPIWSEPGYYQWLGVSPDGTRTALAIADGLSQDVWVFDNERGSRVRLTSAGINTRPIWTPDGQNVVFQSNNGISWAHADGSSAPRPLTKPGTQSQFPYSFSQDGKVLLMAENLPGGGAVIRTVAIDHTGGELRASEPVFWRQSKNSTARAAFSPDGQWIAYQAADAGLYQIYVRHYPDTGRQWPISIAGGTLPVWSRTSKELFFRTDDQALMVATYDTTGGVFKAGRPRLWSPTRLFNNGLAQNFDRAPDGRFAVLLPEEGQKNEPAYVILALNFFSELKRRLGQK